MHNLGQTRSVLRPGHLLQTPDTFVRAPLPGMAKGTAVIHIAPAAGAAFTQYTAELDPGGTLGPTPGQRFLYLLEGEAFLTSPQIQTSLRPGSFAYLPPAEPHTLTATSPAKIAVIEKHFLPSAGSPAPPAAFVGHEADVPPIALEGDADLQVRALIPDALGLDFAVNTMTYQPGAALAMVEIHVMEHGLLMLEGGGIYRLGDQWYPVTAGDFIWMAPFCPQWFGALGKTPAKYLIYKDWNRHPPYGYQQMTDPHVDIDRLTRELHQLSRFTHAEPAAAGTAVTRIVFSEDDLAARAWLRTHVEAEGFSWRVDPVGNTFIRLEGENPSLPAVATGSHIDAIPHAGMYDGTVGVLGGLEALRAIRATGIKPRRPIELILFTAEEPTRFGIGCLGSRLLGGALHPDAADAMPDLTPPAGEAPRLLADIRTAAGFTGNLAEVPLHPAAYAAFVELHIEQGPLLERAAERIGIVTSIAAPASYSFFIEGLGGHAGALLMPHRRDALCAAAELILAIERSSLTLGTLDTVATVGTCAVHPGAVNSVPSRVKLELDLRDIDPARRETVMENIRSQSREIAARRGLSMNETLINADTPATCHPAIVEAIAAEAGAQLGHGKTRLMVSRAYHDTLFMARICPVGMIFIPCRAGVSHRPEEYAAPEDIVAGTAVLARVLARLAAA